MRAVWFANAYADANSDPDSNSNAYAMHGEMYAHAETPTHTSAAALICAEYPSCTCLWPQPEPLRRNRGFRAKGQFGLH